MISAIEVTRAIVIATRSNSDRYMIPFLLLVAWLGILTGAPKRKREGTPARLGYY